ncbi:fucolectin-like isoform X2 [Magallana gigas]|uniref:fucolectin-like isoform X2 n=1 Tax=Magallana gigas TaxID=29159 RepID=UPI0033403A6B
MFSYCLNILLNQFFSPFFNFSVGSKPKLYAKITLVIVSAVTTTVFIAFCIVLGLLIKEKFGETNNNCESGNYHNVLWDIAVGKPAQQSSTFPPNEAERAVDGNRNTDILQNSCSHTADSPEQNPWWRVDLRAVYYIVSVRMLNRGMDEHGIDVSDRLQNVTVTVGLTESSVNTTCGFFAGPGTLSQLVVLVCPPETMGRYVMVSILTGPLTLCEVDVIGF